MCLAGWLLDMTGVGSEICLGWVQKYDWGGFKYIIGLGSDALDAGPLTM